jgi:hypothetical protein
MPEDQDSVTTFRQHFGLVRRRAFEEFAWTRDILIGTGLGLCSVFLQAYWGLISIKDWQEHWNLWVLSIAIPYAIILVPHLLWRFVRAPWQVHQELESRFADAKATLTRDLMASNNDNALLAERISNQTWPENRPRITFDRWGNKEAGGIARQEQGFYLTNHGETALEVVLEDFVLGPDTWSSDPLSSLEAKQKSFVAVERRTFVYGQAQRWNLLDGFSTAKKNVQTVKIKYRDFNNNWYRSTALIKPSPNFGGIEIGPTTQEKLGAS